MPTEVETLSQQIGQIIANSIPDSWQTAWVEVQFEPGVISANGAYLSSQDSTQHSFQVPGSINHLFMQLRRLVKKGDQKWRAAKFILHKDSSFKIDFEY